MGIAPMRQRVWLLLALVPTWVGAHPVDEVVQGAYLTLAPGELRLELDITAGSAVTSEIIKSLDENADRYVTTAEAHTYAQRVLEQSTLVLDGVTASWKLENVSVPPYQNLELGGGTIKIYAVAQRSDSGGAHILSYQNRYQPEKSQWTANVFLRPGGGWHYQVTSQQRSNDGRQLIVNYTATQL